MSRSSCLRYGFLGLVAIAACAPEPARESTRTVTLVTGDRVTLARNGAPIIEPGPGREHVGFIAVRQGAHRFIIPRDVAPLVGRGVLDRAQFDVAPDAEVESRAPPPRAADEPTAALTLRATNRDGSPDASLVVLVDRTRLTLEFLFVNGETTLQLPLGEYNISSLSETFLSYPRLTLDHDTTIELDSRLTAPVALTIPGVDLVIGRTDSTVWDFTTHVGVGLIADETQYTAQLGPEAAPDELRSWIIVSATPPNPPPDSPVHYNLARYELGHAMTGWRETIPRRALATVDASHVADAPTAFLRYISPWFVDGAFFGPMTSVMFRDYPAHARRTEYLYGPGLVWDTALLGLPSASGQFVIDQIEVVRDYRPGLHYVERWHRAPFGPSFADAWRAPAATRTGDAISLATSLFSDADPLNPTRFAFSATEHDYTALYRDDVLVAEQVDAGSVWLDADVDPAPATYRFEARASRGIDPVTETHVFDLSTHVEGTWVFPSANATEVLPLPTVRFLPVLDDDNRAGRVLVLPVEIQRPPSAARPAITNIAVEISYDDGKTWAKLPGAKLGDRWLGIVVHPPGAQFASLRGSARDADGRTNEVTIVRAYRL